MRNFVSFVSHFAARLLLVVLLCLPVLGGNVMAQDAEPYVVFDSSTGVLVFKYDANKPKGAYRLNENSDVPEWNSKHRDDIIKVVFDDSFVQARPTSCSYWFFFCDNLKSIDGIKNLNTTNVTDMSEMFMYCSSLTTLDVSGFDTRNVTNMTSMFYNCSNLITLDVSGFDTHNVTNMASMFSNCSNLTTLDVSGFVTNNVTSIACMFVDCSSLTTLDVSGFDTHNVTDMSGMFYGCSGLTTIDVSGFDTHNVTDMSGMFEFCSGLITLDVSGFNTYNVTDMSGMFRGCSNFTTLDLSVFDTHNVTNMSYMFEDCSNLATLDVSGFVTQNVTDMFEMFYGCSCLTALDVSSFDTHNVTDMGSMFHSCSNLTALNLSGFDTHNVTSMSYMFEDCSNLTKLDVSGFDTHNVTAMTSMFWDCSSLTTLDISSFDTQNVMYTDFMFYFCSGLITIYASDKFIISNDTDDYLMFSGCFSLKGATAYDDYKVGKDMANYNTGYFTTYYKLADELYPLCGESLNVENLTLIDGKDFVARAPFEAATVSYSRKMNEDITWETLCLPFDFSLENQNFRAFKLLSVNGDMVELQEVKSCVAAGTPIIIKMDHGATDINIKECESMIVREAQKSEIVDNCQLVGLYMQKKLSSVEEDNCCFIVKDGKLMNAAIIMANTTAKDVELDGFRAYMRDRAFWSSQAKVYTLVFDDDTNGVKNLEITTEGKEEYYDLQGHQLDDLKKGVNIVKRGDKTIKVIVK